MSQTSRRRVGQSGEQAAASYLEQRGYQVITRNYRTTYGEIAKLPVPPKPLLFSQRRNARQHLSRQKLERCSAAGGYVRDLVGQARGLDRFLGIAAAHH